jgi:hypothetical protein
MTAGPQKNTTNIIFVPVPVAGTDYGRREYPQKYPAKHKDRREPWKPASGIPDRAAHREMVRRLLERSRAQREQAIKQAKAMLARA